MLLPWWWTCFYWTLLVVDLTIPPIVYSFVCLNVPIKLTVYFLLFRKAKKKWIIHYLSFLTCCHKIRSGAGALCSIKWLTYKQFQIACCSLTERRPNLLPLAKNMHILCYICPYTKRKFCTDKNSRSFHMKSPIYFHDFISFRDITANL